MPSRKSIAPSIDAYLAQVPEPAYSTLQSLRALIRSTAPRQTTETISYGIPAFRYRGLLVGFGAFARHCSFFPMSARLIHEMAADLSAYSTSKGAIRFPADRPLPAALVRKIVKARVAEQKSKTPSPPRPAR
jgi:uncharacterized protein YdhG (YjbR/CyaY superfamily)